MDHVPLTPTIRNQHEIQPFHNRRKSTPAESVIGGKFESSEFPALWFSARTPNLARQALIIPPRLRNWLSFGISSNYISILCSEMSRNSANLAGYAIFGVALNNSHMWKLVSMGLGTIALGCSIAHFVDSNLVMPGWDLSVDYLAVNSDSADKVEDLIGSSVKDDREDYDDWDDSSSCEENGGVLWIKKYNLSLIHYHLYTVTAACLWEIYCLFKH